MRKFIAVLLILMAVMTVLVGCSQESKDGEHRVVHAKIRYFDGSMDTLEVDRWFASQSGTVTIFTAEGRKVVIGANNIILIDETEDQYEH